MALGKGITHSRRQSAGELLNLHTHTVCEHAAVSTTGKVWVVCVCEHTLLKVQSIPTGKL